MASDRDHKIDELLAKQEIMECLTRFCRGMDRFDRECFISAFHEDAVMAAGPYVGDVQGCWDWSVPMHEEGQILTHHSLLNNTTEIDGPPFTIEIARRICSHDATQVCSNDGECASVHPGSVCTDRTCTHDPNALCGTDAQCDALSPGSTCTAQAAGTRRAICPWAAATCAGSRCRIAG